MVKNLQSFVIEEKPIYYMRYIIDTSITLQYITERKVI